MTDPRVQRVLKAGVQRLLDALRQVGPAGVDAMERQLQAGVRADAQRFTFQLAIGEMRRKMAPWHQAVAAAMQNRLQEDLQQGGETDGSRRFSDTDWRTLALVDDQEVEQQVKVDRAARTLVADCDWELRELEAQLGGPRNPVRPERVVQALQAGLEVVSQDAEVRAALLQQFVRTLAPLMKNWYAAVGKELTRQGVQARTMAVRQSEGPGFDLPRDSHRDAGGYETLQPRAARVTPPSHDPAAVRALGEMFGVPVPSGFGNPSTGRGAEAGPSSRGGMASRPGALGGPGGGTGPGALGAGALDAQLREVMRRMTLAALPALEHGPAGAPGWAARPGSGPGASAPGAPVHGGPASGSAAAGAGGAPLWSDGVDWSRAGDSQSGAPVAANLIRLHRDQLMEASGGAINHMVIDVVAALFDQILADPKVPPQMARLIARLQLPVLRAALHDIEFFRRRNHPVRRLVNRIASLAAAFDDFEAGPGLEFLDRVRRLVQEIIDGDFDQLQVYERQLDEIEALVREQTAGSAPQNRDIAALLQEKEATLRVQQRYTLALKEQLAKVEIAEFARDFLAQIWSQVIVLATRQEGPDGALVKRMKDAGRELALSLQPKGTPQHRKEFLMRLPALMKDLNEGLTLIRWPEKARKEFFGKLLPAHAESLKGQPLTDFAQRQLAAQLDQVDRIHVPAPTELQPPAGVDLPVLSEPVDIDLQVEAAFTEDEVKAMGLVEERQVDWDGQVDIDLDSPGTAAGEHQDAQTSTMDLDLNLDEAGSPGQGTELLHHMQPGCAYLMQVDQGGWKKVRLSWVSPGRGFFVFNHGRQQQKTVSMTSRMLHRMLESGRFRAFEQRELIERATIRARRQLAALGGSAPVTRH